MKWILFLLYTTITLNLYAPELSVEAKNEMKLNYEKYKKHQYLLTAEFSKQNLKDLLNALNLPDPEIIYIQSIIETGHFKSKLFKNHNNIFGMHKSYKRKSTAIGYVIADNGSKVAKYETWQDSVKDFVLYINYWESKGYDTTDYKKFLTDVGYCELGSYYLVLIDKFRSCYTT